MSENRGQRIYKTIMLILITVLITGTITTIMVYQKVSGITSSATRFRDIDIGQNSSGLELTLTKLRAMLDQEYIGTIDDQKMLENAIKGYIEGLGDPYAQYYTPEEMSNQLDEAMGNYVGIGIYMLVSSSSGTITVTEPMEGSPAKKAGIKSGDKIIKVNGEEVTSENAASMSNKIKGEEGTKVKLEIKRNEEIIPFEIKRERIVMSHIKSRMLNDNIGYIKISDFDGGVAKEFNDKYNELKKDGIKSLIIDVRDNGGGVVAESIEILDMLCEKDSTLLITNNKNNKEQTTKDKKKQEIDLPIVVLTNKNSASASEIFAGALKDNKRATLVGNKTYGKGVIQTLIKLSDGSGLKITTEEYYTPNRKKINNEGIEPDYKVDLAPYTGELVDADDTQLQKAIELLK